MPIKVEHELHARRRGRNTGTALVLGAFVVLMLGLTVVKVQGLDDIRQFEATDHVLRPALIPEDD